MARKIFSAFSVNCSVLLHVLLLAVATGVSMLPGCRKKELVVPLDFTVVLPDMYEQDDVPEDKPDPVGEGGSGRGEEHLPRV